MRALEFGPLEELRQRYAYQPGLADLFPEVPDAQTMKSDQLGPLEPSAVARTLPSVVFKSETPQRQVIPWDSTKALALWQKRHPDSGEALPDVFASQEDVTDVPDDTYRRGRLHLNARSVEEQIKYTTDDE